MYNEASKTETQEIIAESDQNMTVGRLQEKYQDLMDRNIKLSEEVSRLRFENSYLSRQSHCSDLKSDSEFQKNLKDLIILSHPDKHGGHERAIRITQWLLQLRK
jgi:hypothetical protein